MRLGRRSSLPSGTGPSRNWEANWWPRGILAKRPEHQRMDSRLNLGRTSPLFFIIFRADWRYEPQVLCSRSLKGRSLVISAPIYRPISKQIAVRFEPIVIHAIATTDDRVEDSRNRHTAGSMVRAETSIASTKWML